MSEFRQDRTTGFWTIVAPERNWRPQDGAAGGARQKPVSGYDPSCPFCPGNEAALPSIIEETPGEAQPRWRTRVVPNKFPILGAGATAPADPLDEGYGIHEVIIETPRHDADLLDFGEAEMQDIIATWHRRFEAALARPDIKTVLVFRNHGRGAGASLEHSHSQLVAMPLVPPRLAMSLDWAHRHRDAEQECVTCRELVLEIESGRRVVEVTEEFAVLVPFAAGSPLQQWIVPRAHEQSFLKAKAHEREALAGVLRRAFGRLKSLAGSAACNLTIEPGSHDPAYRSVAHWSVRVVPNLTTPGGFEMLSGVAVNPSSPEQDAGRLRASSVGCI